ncbi:hypothetical protein D3C87_299640 [compost metagenome]
MYDRRTSNGRPLSTVLEENGVPRGAVDLIFRFFDFNQGRIVNVNTAVVVDYSQPSTQKRLLILDLKQGAVEKHYVSHGINSGVVETRRFSNVVDSWQSSLGFYYAIGTYKSQKNGLSLYLEGLDRSNNASKERAIVLHGAKYVSEQFIQQNGRLGWSEGCLAVALEVAPRLIDMLKEGSVVLSFHKDLMVDSRRYPLWQELAGQELVPPGVNMNRTPGEGGGL